MNTSTIKIAIADDHPIVIVGVEAVLAKDPEKVLLAKVHSGRQLFELLSKDWIDVLLLDLNMPGENHEAIIDRIRQYYPTVRIIVYTSYNDPDLVKSLLKQGVSGYLLKNSPGSELRDAIARVYAGDIFIGSRVKTSQLDTDDAPQPIPAIRDNFQKRISLSKREQEILKLISKGYTSQTIGDELYISKHTVETHRKNILRKLEFNSSTELVKFAVQQGLV